MSSNLKLFAILLFFSFTKAGYSQLIDHVIDKAVEKAAEEIPTILLGPSDLDDPGGAVDTTMDWTAIWRSSDSLGGRSGYYRYGANDWEARPKGKRIGCTCMDGYEDKHLGRGACSGHGGVRYWKYLTPEGEVVDHPTARHFRHPDTLSTDEKSGLSAYNEEEDSKEKPFGSGVDIGSFTNLAIVVASMTLVAYYIRQMMGEKKKAKRRKSTKKKAVRKPRAKPQQDGTGDDGEQGNLA